MITNLNYDTHSTTECHIKALGQHKFVRSFGWTYKRRGLYLGEGFISQGLYSRGLYLGTYIRRGLYPGEGFISRGLISGWTYTRDLYPGGLVSGGTYIWELISR